MVRYSQRGREKIYNRSREVLCNYLGRHIANFSDIDLVDGAIKVILIKGDFEGLCKVIRELSGADRLPVMRRYNYKNGNGKNLEANYEEKYKQSLPNSDKDPYNALLSLRTKDNFAELLMKHVLPLYGETHPDIGEAEDFEEG